MSSDSDKEEEETEKSAEEKTAKEDQPFTAEQVRTSLEECFRDLETQYGYADLGGRYKEISFGPDYNYGEYDDWTELYGIAKAKIFDLDGDGVNYLLFLQAYWGGWGDGFYAQARLYRYNGTDLYTPLTVVQESEASAEYVYFARQYDADGAKLSEEVIYDDTAQYGVCLQEDHCRERMKELFGAYGITIGNYAKMFIYDTSFYDFLAYEESREELMKLRMISLSLPPDEGLEALIRFGFNDDENTSGYIIPGSDTMYLWPSDLYSLTQGECRLARNEIYARHGRMFDDSELQYYFDTQEWYTGTITPEDFSDDVLNEYEIYNRDIIAEYEKEMGYQ